jgi:hypothetical protein
LPVVDAGYPAGVEGGFRADPSIKDTKTYREVRRSVASKEKATKVGIPGRPSMTRDRLVDALRND